MNVFSVNLINLRKILFPKKKELVKKLSISLDTLENWEKGKHLPNLDFCEDSKSDNRIKASKRCSIDEIISAMDEKYLDLISKGIIDISSSQKLLNNSGLTDDVKNTLVAYIDQKNFAGKLLKTAFEYQIHQRNINRYGKKTTKPDSKLTIGFDDDLSTVTNINHPCLIRMENSIRYEEFSEKFSVNGDPIYIPPYIPEEVIITKDVFRIGRESEYVDLVCCNNYVSRRHAEISFKDGKYLINDTSSKHGTYVNGKAIKTDQILKDKDIISFAHSDYMFTVPKSKKS